MGAIEGVIAPGTVFGGDELIWVFRKRRMLRILEYDWEI